MKTLTSPTLAGKIFLLLLVTICACIMKVFAQDIPENVDVDISTNGGTAWYGQPWMWVLGVAVFIVIIVAITRSGNKTA